MNNFLEFINDDIEAKKTLLSTMPVKTKVNIKAYNDKIDFIYDKYTDYMKGVKKYIEVKSKSFNIKKEPNDLEELKNKIANLEKARFVLNPLNTFFEKLGFDDLMYEISNYNDSSFDNLTQIINCFLDKFELANIKITVDEFNYTYYARKFMKAFLEARNNKVNNYDTVSEVFEKIYWSNPDIIQNVELNFKKIIKKHKNKLCDYVENLKKEECNSNGLKDYDDCLKELESLNSKLKLTEKETISDIIILAKDGSIDMSQYFPDSKIRVATYEELLIDKTYLNDKTMMEDFYDNLYKLKSNILEYNLYVEFQPLIEDFKKQYSSIIEKNDQVNISNKEVKDIESRINNEEAKLDKINKKIFTKKSGLFKTCSDSEIKQLKIDSMQLAKNLYDLYKTYDEKNFEIKVLTTLSNTSTISELLNLYYSFDYFKKNNVKKVYGINKYSELVEMSEKFDKFAINPKNIIVNGTSLFNENNIDKVIMNKYRLNNINLTDENLNEDVLEVLLDKIQLLIRIHEIESSQITVEKVWFMAEVERLTKKEK